MSDDDPVVYDVATVADAILSGTAGLERQILGCFSFLDDLVLQLGQPMVGDNDDTMVHVVRRLTEGESLGELIDAVGGAARLLDLLYALVGRVVMGSSLACRR